MAILPLLNLASCASVPEIPEKPVKQSIEPIARPDWRAGDVYTMVDIVTGEPAGYTIQTTNEQHEIIAQSDRIDKNANCNWTVSKDWFSPVTNWNKCGDPGEWHSGTHSVKLVKGNPWPLTPGANATYTHVPTSSAGKRGTK